MRTIHKVIIFIIIISSIALFFIVQNSKKLCQYSESDNPVIKGNINKDEKKIYHIPGQMYYKMTKIDTSIGEKWFCTEKEALENGWRKSKL